MLINKSIEELIHMDNDDLRELLVEENTNSQELKEIIYRLISHSLTQERRINNYVKQLERLEELETNERMKDYYPKPTNSKMHKF